MNKTFSPAEVLPFLHGCCGTFELDGCTGFSRFTPDQLAYYSRRSDADFVRSHAPAGIYLECLTDEPEISFTYRLYGRRGFYINASGIDLCENGIFAANYPINPDESGNVTVTYTRKSREPSVIRIYFPNGCVFLPVEFRLGNALPTEKQERLVLFYGDSITQSAYIPTPSLSWFRPVAEHLGAEYLNRGIGSMVFDKDSLPAVPDCAPDMIFVEYGANDLGKTPDNETALAAADAWLTELCRRYPDAEKYAVLPDFFPDRWESDAVLRRRDAYCAGLTELCRARSISALPGKPLIPELDALYFGDHVHFNEAGSAIFADRLLYTIRHRKNA